MRKFIIILSVMLCVAGCKKKASGGLDITGIWNIVDVTPLAKSAEIGSETVDVYIEFRQDKTFSLYQMLGAGSFRYFSGTWTLSGTVLDGKYSDGKAWGSRYEAEVSGDMLTLTSTGEVYTYKKVSALPSI